MTAPGPTLARPSQVRYWLANLCQLAQRLSPRWDPATTTTRATAFDTSAAHVTRDFGFLPIPARCRRAGDEVIFSAPLNWLLAATSTFTIANLYYPQPILVQLASRYDVPYKRVTLAPTLLQCGYLTGILLITPLNDLVPRRALLLALVFMTATLSLGQATATTFEGFQALCFVVGIFTVTPQVVNPLTADLAPTAHRFSAVSITISGLLSGMVFARLFAGLIARLTGHPNDVYYLSAATQFTLWLLLYAFLPDVPVRATGLGYFGILRSMVKLLVTEPVLLQSCVTGMCLCAIMTNWWTTLTFLLTAEPFGFNTFEIGLFGLTGIAAVLTVPFAGKITDRLHPWLVLLIAFLGQTSVAAIACGAAGLNLAPVIFVCICVDILHQTNTLGQQARIYAISPLSRGRINGVYMLWVFAGQAIGTSAGPRIFLRQGWRACYGFSVALGGTAIAFLLLRGPGAQGWFGWGSNWTFAKDQVDDVTEVGIDSKDGDKEQGPTSVDERERVSRSA